MQAGGKMSTSLPRVLPGSEPNGSTGREQGSKSKTSQTQKDEYNMFSMCESQKQKKTPATQ